MHYKEVDWVSSTVKEFMVDKFNILINNYNVSGDAEKRQNPCWNSLGAGMHL